MSKVGNPCPTLGQLLASRILYALLVREKQHEIARARLCTQKCSKVDQLLVNALPALHPMGSCRGLPFNSPLATPECCGGEHGLDTRNSCEVVRFVKLGIRSARAKAFRPGYCEVIQVTNFAAQCEIPPPLSRHTFSRWYRRGGITPICLVFKGYRASIAEIPLLLGGGISHLHFACSPKGRRSEKGDGVSHQIGDVETSKTL